MRIALLPGAQIGDAGFEKYRFVHNALPQINYDKIDTSTTFLNKKVSYPFFISCMTGGITKGELINRRLAKAAQKYNIAMGVGSQRAAIEHPELEKLFKVRQCAPDIPLMANIGLVQLNYGYGLAEFVKCVGMIEADALVVHLNPIQEVIQPEGDHNFEDLLPKLEKIVKKLSVPVIAKEVGFGLSEDVVKRLYRVGVRHFDTAGWGGTNWSVVEGMRSTETEKLGELFSEWGIPTANSIIRINELRKSFKQRINVLGSGGVRSGLDVAKAIALGADLVGLATPFAQAALKSQKAVENLIERLATELKIAMFGVGASKISELKKALLLTLP